MHGCLGLEYGCGDEDGRGNGILKLFRYWAYSIKP